MEELIFAPDVKGEKATEREAVRSIASTLIDVDVVTSSNDW